MFTGLIKHTAVLRAIDSHQEPWRLYVSNPFTNLTEGESIAVDGICLTLTDYNDQWLGFDVSPETRSKTTVPQWQPDQILNIERPLMAGDALGGHFVTGHIDGTVTVSGLEIQGGCYDITFTDIQENHLPCLVEKGSVTINGVSLTINQVTSAAFNVTLIPETIERTNLGQLSIGKLVNIEYDILSKLVERQFQLRQKGSDHETRDN